MTAPASPGMTDDERARLATATLPHGSAWNALDPLVDPGRDGRGAPTVAPRAAPESSAMEHDAWRVLALRAADDGRTASMASRTAMLAAARARGMGAIASAAHCRRGGT